MLTTLNVKLITENLADELILGMQHATGIYIMTSFVMQSGVRLLAPHLKEAIDRGAEVKVLAGDYLFVTQPEGLRIICNIDPRLEGRLWRSGGASFHPKAYLFDYENGEGLLIVGSSNFSLSALRMGMEWNLAMNAQVEPYTFQMALDKFMENFYHESTLPLNHETVLLYEYRQYHRKNPELILGLVGIPLEGLAFIAGIDRLLDMARTVVNVLGNSLAAVVMSKWEKQYDKSKGERYVATLKKAS